MIKCLDWDNNPKRECGGGLHLSPTPKLALLYKQGIVKDCWVDVKDFIIYKYNVTKVRCKKVFVIGIYNEHK